MDKGLKIYADLHTHTKYSHGKGTIEENVKAAIKKGLKTIAITDHGPAHLFIGVKKNKLNEMENEIKKLRKKYPEIKILFGLEANIIGIDGTIDVPEEYINKLDILLAGIHPVVIPASFKDGLYLGLLNKLNRYLPIFTNILRKINTKALINAIKKYPIKIISHPGHNVDIDTKELAKAAALEGVALEINTGHKNMSIEFVQIVRDAKGKFSIGSDAHKPEDVGDFAYGIEILAHCNISSDMILNTTV